MWHLCLGVSILVLLYVIIYLIRLSRSKKSVAMSPMNILMMGVFVATTIMFIPVYAEIFGSDNLISRVFKTIIISMHHTIRLFFVDSDFEVIRNLAGSKEGLFYNIYSCYAAILFVLSPVMTFGVVLSFFKSASVYRQYVKCYNENIYVFSKLNEKSLALAESIMEHHTDAKIIFNSTRDQIEGSDKSRVRRIKAICFEGDILSVNFNFHNSNKEIKLFVIDDNESENVKQALMLIEKYRDRKNTWLYVFSNEFEGEVLLSSIDTNQLILRRISDIRTLIYSLLEKSGELLFKEAIDTTEYEDKKLISAVVVGLEKHGMEMTRSLVWFGQMEGYRLEITAFDKNTDAKERFSAICPEIMEEGYNNNFEDDGESQYKIDIKASIDVDTITFIKELQKLKYVTYVFVDVGSDEMNIKTAIKLRSLLLKNDLSPRIQAVVGNSERKNALSGITNHSGQSYDIDFVGDVRSLYSIGSIIESGLENEALSRHLKWGQEEVFWKYEYNYRSSIASALHRRMKIKCGVPGINKDPKERNEEERLNLRKMEHRRWNAYMRSEGFTFSEKRNNLAKMHHCLITYEDLTPEEKAKDDD